METVFYKMNTNSVFVCVCVCVCVCEHTVYMHWVREQ